MAISLTCHQKALHGAPFGVLFPLFLKTEKVMTVDEQSAILAQLAEPFAISEIKWRVTHSSCDGKRGAVKPYADPRAYQDR